MRKTKNITLMEDGQELKFLIKQMSAMQLLRWTMQLAGLLGKSGLEVPGAKPNDPRIIAEALNTHGQAGILAALGRLGPDDIQPLIDGLLACCRHVTGPNSLTRLDAALVDSIIGNPHTLTALLREAAMMILDFWMAEGILEDLGASLSGSPAGEVLRFNLCTDPAPTPSSPDM